MSRLSLFYRWFPAIIVYCMICASPIIAVAEDGDEDLAKAKELRSKIQSIEDMEKVTDLCESAIDKGLSDEAKKEANKIWAEVLFQQATARQISATTRRDLEDIAALCEKAVEKGLDEETESVAKGMWSSSLFQYAEQFSLEIFQTPPNPRWRFYRTQALSRLEEAIKVNPKYAEAYLLSARLNSLPDGDGAKAEEYAQKAIEHAGDSQKIKSQAYVELAKQARAPSKRERLFEQAIEADPENELALSAKADRLMKDDKIKEAITVLEKLIAINEKNLAAQSILIRAYIADEQYEQAIEQSDAALKFIPESSPQASIIYSLRGQTYVFMGNKDLAIKDLGKSIEIQKNNFEALMLRAGVYLDNEDYDLALEDVNRTLEVVPGLKRAYLLRSYILAGKEEFDPAIRDILLLAQDEPSNLDFINQLGYLCNASDRPRKAVEFFSRVLRRDKDNIQALRGRGDSYLSYGDHENAIKDYKAALAIDPENTGVLNNYAWVLATSTDESMRDGELAIELGEKACKLTENKQAHILSTLASGYAESGDFESAIKWAEKAVETSEDDEQKKGLNEELESYKQGKPWREKEEVEEGPWPPKQGEDEEDID